MLVIYIAGNWNGSTGIVHHPLRGWPGKGDTLVALLVAVGLAMDVKDSVPMVRIKGYSYKTRQYVS